LIERVRATLLDAIAPEDANDEDAAAHSRSKSSSSASSFSFDLDQSGADLAERICPGAAEEYHRSIANGRCCTEAHEAVHSSVEAALLQTDGGLRDTRESSAANRRGIVCQAPPLSRVLHDAGASNASSSMAVPLKLSLDEGGSWISLRGATFTYFDAFTATAAVSASVCGASSQLEGREIASNKCGSDAVGLPEMMADVNIRISSEQIDLPSMLQFASPRCGIGKDSSGTPSMIVHARIHRLSVHRKYAHVTCELPGALTALSILAKNPRYGGLAVDPQTSDRDAVRLCLPLSISIDGGKQWIFHSQPG